MKISISAAAITKVLTSFITLLLIAHIIQALLFLAGARGYVRFLDFDMERNLPTFYSSLAIEFCAVLLALIFVYHKKRKDAYHWAWLGLAIIFAFLGIDEATKIHETLGSAITPMVDATGVLYFPWIVPYSIGFAIISLFFIPWFIKLPSSAMIGFSIAGIVFLSGAMGFEMLSAIYAEQTSLDSKEYIWSYTAEETCEMLGIMLFIRALIKYISTLTPELTVSFSS